MFLFCSMNADAPLSSCQACDQRAAETDVCRSALMELVGIGMEMARLVRDEAKEGQAAEAAVAFDRVARAVRRTVRLKQWLDQPVPGRDAGARVAARVQIIRAVEDTIDRRVGEAEAEPLHAELLERLDGLDVEDDIGRRPVGEIVAEICRDLGVGNLPGVRPWVRRRPADVAVLQARAAAVAGATRHVMGCQMRLGVPSRDGDPGGGCRDGPAVEALAVEELAVVLAGLGRRE